MTLPKGQKHQMATTVWPGHVQIIPCCSYNGSMEIAMCSGLWHCPGKAKRKQSLLLQRAHGESKKALRQLTHLKEVLQTRDKPARGFHGLVSQTSPLQVSRQGLLTAAEETA